MAQCPIKSATGHEAMNLPKMSVKKRLGHLGHMTRPEPTLPSQHAGRNAIEGKYPSIQLPVLPVHELAFCALFGPKESGDKAVTSGDMLGGLVFRPESGKLSKVVAEPAFHRKPANLEARASHLQSDTKNGLFGLDRFERFFAPKNGAGWSGDFSGDKLGGLTDSGDEAVTSRRDRFWAKKRRFGQVARAHGEMV